MVEDLQRFPDEMFDTRNMYYLSVVNNCTILLSVNVIDFRFFGF